MKFIRHYLPPSTSYAPPPCSLISSLLPMHKHCSIEVYYMVDFVPPPYPCFHTSQINEICRHWSIFPSGCPDIFVIWNRIWSSVARLELALVVIWPESRELPRRNIIYWGKAGEWGRNNNYQRMACNHGTLYQNANIHTSFWGKWFRGSTQSDRVILHFHVPFPQSLKIAPTTRLCVCMLCVGVFFFFFWERRTQQRKRDMRHGHKSLSSWLYLRLDMQSQSLIRWQAQICHPNIDAITARDECTQA